VATYELDYDKGKIIHLGLWGHMLAQNKGFMDFLNNEIIPLSLNSTYNKQLCTINQPSNKDSCYFLRSSLSI
jgi:hypothetical protein